MAHQPLYTLIHISDTHLVAERAPLHGAVDADAQLAAVLAKVSASGLDIDAIVVSGDVADAGAPDAYRRARQMVEAAAASLDAKVIWAMGNHDERVAFRTELLDGPATDEPIDYVVDLDDLRIVVLDSTDIGLHAGALDQAQYAWLEQQLLEAPSHGSVVVVHHPPIASHLEMLQYVELAEMDRFIAAVQDRSVRAVLSGHYHYPTFASAGDVSLVAAGATVYIQDLFVPADRIRGEIAGQSFGIIQIYPDRVVTSVIPVTAGPTLYELTVAQLEAAMAELASGGPVDLSELDFELVED